MTFTYDLLDHPLAIAGSDNQTDYVYSADGRKFRATHTQCMFKNGALDVCHYFIQDYQGNNRILIGSNGQRDQYSHFYPYGGLMGDISTNDPHSYKYGGKELDRDFGIDLFDFEARQYDAKVPGFTSIDPLAEKYYSISPYAYCAGDPVNLVDPTGKYSIWCNGQAFEANRHSKSYWGNLPDIVREKYGERTFDYRDGSIGGWGNTFSTEHSRHNLASSDRIRSGAAEGFNSASSIISQLQRNEQGDIIEPITIFAHSMGCAYAKGFVSGLIDWMNANPDDCEGIRITEYDFSAFQPASQSAVDGVETFQYAHTADMVCPLGSGSNDRIKGVAPDHYFLTVDGDHKIETYTKIFNNLPSGNSYVFRNGQFVKEQ